jgi:hypothetical protein
MADYTVVVYDRVSICDEFACVPVVEIEFINHIFYKRTKDCSFVLSAAERKFPNGKNATGLQREACFLLIISGSLSDNISLNKVKIVVLYSISG